MGVNRSTEQEQSRTGEISCHFGLLSLSGTSSEFLPHRMWVKRVLFSTLHGKGFTLPRSNLTSLTAGSIFSFNLPGKREHVPVCDERKGQQAPASRLRAPGPTPTASQGCQVGAPALSCSPILEGCYTRRLLTN